MPLVTKIIIEFNPYSAGSANVLSGFELPAWETATLASTATAMTGFTVDGDNLVMDSMLTTARAEFDAPAGLGVDEPLPTDIRVTGSTDGYGDVPYKVYFVAWGTEFAVANNMLNTANGIDWDALVEPTVEAVSGTLELGGGVLETVTFVEGVDGTLVAVGVSATTQTFIETVSGTLELVGDVSTGLGFIETVSGTLVVAGAAEETATILERVAGRLVVAGDVTLLGTLHVVWVSNVATNAFSRYENYPYDSFAKINGRYYGCAADGIYELDGETDNEAPIQAMVSFGKQDCGTSALKRVSNIYVGTSSGGKLFVKVLVEGEEYLYQARDGSEELQVQRFDLGRGLRANYLEFELYNADGDDFELASVEFVAVPLSRRI